MSKNGNMKNSRNPLDQSVRDNPFPDVETNEQVRARQQQLVELNRSPPVNPMQPGGVQMTQTQSYFPPNPNIPPQQGYAYQPPQQGYAYQPPSQQVPPQFQVYNPNPNQIYAPNQSFGGAQQPPMQYPTHYQQFDIERHSSSSDGHGNFSLTKQQRQMLLCGAITCFAIALILMIK